MNEDLRTYILENMDEGTVIDLVPIEAAPKTQFKKIKSKNNNKKILEDIKYNAQEDMMFGNMMEETCLPNMSLEDYINNHMKEYNDFQKTLFKMIDDRNLTDPEVYNKVNISRKLFSKIRNEYNYHPKKETVILLGLSLELSLEDMEYLLDSASYSLPKNNYFDLIIRYCFHKNIYDVYKINEMLEEYNCKLLNI